MLFENLVEFVSRNLSRSLVVASVFLLFFGLVLADEENEVVINEVAWMGTEKSSHDEWIELKNLSDDDIDLGGWTLETADCGIYNDEGRAEEEDDEEDCDKIVLEGEIDSEGFFLLERSDDETVEDKKADLIYTGSLSNGGEDLILRDEDGEKVDEIEAEDDWLAGDNDEKKTMARNENGDWVDSLLSGGTPGEENDEETIDEEDLARCVLEEREGLDEVIFNEIFPNPLENEDENEWIEIYNLGEESVDLTGCFLADENLYEKGDLDDYYEFDDEEILVGGYGLIGRDDFDFGMNNGGEEVFLLDSEGEILDKISYDESFEDFSLALDDLGEWQWTSIKTPGEANQFPIPEVYPEGIWINEIMPNPEGVDKNAEWIELVSREEEKVDLEGWCFCNQSNQNFKLDGIEIESDEILKVEIKESSFSIKNSDGWVGLKNPNQEIVDKVEYFESASVDVSYNKKQDDFWEWSVFITPGEENEFNHLPTYELKIPEEIYEDVKAEFEIKKAKDKDGEKLKYRWDFGDGSKSYLKETTHIFDKKGKYSIQTRVSDASSEVFKDLKITVKKFPEFDLRIVKILPNPVGSDSKNEKIWIENLEDKRINLKGWVIATGKNSNKLTNHYFKDDFKIKAGAIKEAERGDCPFSLLNKKGRVVLKSPNGAVVDKVKYEKERIEEGELYFLENDVWIWENPLKLEEDLVEVLGATDLIEREGLRNEVILENLNLILSNSRLRRTNSKEATFFESWLLGQSEEWFFRFIFPEFFWR